MCSPPLRTKDHWDELWTGLVKDDLQLVATDHCPFDFHGQKELGEGDFRKIPNGLPGVEDRIDLLHDGGVVAGRISRERWVDIISTAPAKLFGMYPRKGAIAVGSDADLVVYDPTRTRTISAGTHHMDVDYSCYEGRTVQGAQRRRPVAWLGHRPGRRVHGTQGRRPVHQAQPGRLRPDGLTTSLVARTPSARDGVVCPTTFSGQARDHLPRVLVRLGMTGHDLEECRAPDHQHHRHPPRGDRGRPRHVAEQGDLADTGRAFGQDPQRLAGSRDPELSGFEDVIRISDVAFADDDFTGFEGHPARLSGEPFELRWRQRREDLDRPEQIERATRHERPPVHRPQPEPRVAIPAGSRSPNMTSAPSTPRTRTTSGARIDPSARPARPSPSSAPKTRARTRSGVTRCRIVRPRTSQAARPIPAATTSGAAHAGPDCRQRDEADAGGRGGQRKDRSQPLPTDEREGEGAAGDHAQSERGVQQGGAGGADVEDLEGEQDEQHVEGADDDHPQRQDDDHESGIAMTRDDPESLEKPVVRRLGIIRPGGDVDDRCGPRQPDDERGREDAPSRRGAEHRGRVRDDQDRRRQERPDQETDAFDRSRQTVRRGELLGVRARLGRSAAWVGRMTDSEAEAQAAAATTNTGGMSAAIAIHVEPKATAITR